MRRTFTGAQDAFGGTGGGLPMRATKRPSGFDVCSLDENRLYVSQFLRSDHKTDRITDEIVTYMGGMYPFVGIQIPINRMAVASNPPTQ